MAGWVLLNPSQEKQWHPWSVALGIAYWDWEPPCVCSCAPVYALRKTNLSALNFSRLSPSVPLQVFQFAVKESLITKLPTNELMNPSQKKKRKHRQVLNMLVLFLKCNQIHCFLCQRIPGNPHLAPMCAHIPLSHRAAGAADPSLSLLLGALWPQTGAPQEWAVPREGRCCVLPAAIAPWLVISCVCADPCVSSIILALAFALSSCSCIILIFLLFLAAWWLVMLEAGIACLLCRLLVAGSSQWRLPCPQPLCASLAGCGPRTAGRFS